jgi:hypothetical protein
MFSLVASLLLSAQMSSVRPPAVPLITHDPYFSVWSFNENLASNWTRHWTGAIQAMAGMIRIDGKTYRWAGTPPQVKAAMKQTSLTVTATQSTFEFLQDGVRLRVNFLSPLLADDLDLLSTPISYVQMEASSEDGKEHEIGLYIDTTGEWVVNSTSQEITWGRLRIGGDEVLRLGTAGQHVLNSVGDDRRIDWGYLCSMGPGSSTSLGSDRAVRGGFAKGELSVDDDFRMPRPAEDNWPVAAHVWSYRLKAKEPQKRTLIVGYDAGESIEYFRRPLRGYWQRAGKTMAEALREAKANEASITARATKFDAELERKATEAGGKEFASLCAVAYRQAIAAHKLVCDLDGEPLFFSKENFSNGCIATVDVTYPSAPLFLWLNHALAKGMIVPILQYANSSRWKFDFAPHDLGTFPKANGQVYGGGEQTEENQMPVEECGNMLILVAGVCKAEGNLDLLHRFPGVLDKWARYLEAKGLDPENQLCTDDFAGHLAHNANLSIKAIVGLGAYAQLLERDGQKALATRFMTKAKAMAKDWMKLAADGDLTKLAFDRTGTWSQKYNLVWDELLGLNLFPKELRQREVKSYLKRMNKFGLPLDNRATYTKLDWCIWTACLADDRASFDAMVAPLTKWMNETPTRVPLTDWYDTVSGKQIGFQARSVVGGIFLPMLKRAWR